MFDKIGLVGCGSIGKKRAAALRHRSHLVCFDVNSKLSKDFATQNPHTQSVDSADQIIKDPQIHVILIATPHDALAELIFRSLKERKFVFVEKPAAKNSFELDKIIKAFRDEALKKVRVGFNHRYHPAIQKAKEIVDRGELGRLMFIRARYGHGGRLNYHKEWRANPQISGGGELIDQGVHLIDLARYFLGNFSEIDGFAHTYYWDMPVEDNGFLLLKTKDKKTAFLHASCTEWKNTFSFEIYGELGKLHVEGLGGSYGVEKLAFYSLRPEMGPPDTVIWEFPGPDTSWEVELNEFFEDISFSRNPAANLKDAVAALNIVEKIYQRSNYDYYKIPT